MRAGSAPYHIAVFVKHAFERLRKRDFRGLARAFPALVAFCIADFQPPIGAPVVVPEHQVPGLLALAEPDFLRQFPENGTFLLNAVDWMTLGPELIGIRSRAADQRLLAPVSDQARSFIKFVNVVGVPLLIALLGLALRNRSRVPSTTA